MKRLLLLSLFLCSSVFAVESVEVIPLRGPIGTAVIAPGNGSATAYRMDYPGQKSICFKTNSDTIVYISSASTIGANGFPLEVKGASVCLDLQGGTTTYHYGASAGGDVRAIFGR